MENKKKWYQKSWGIIAILILFFPAGLFLMWTYSNWGNKTKWIVTGAFLVFMLIGATSDNSSNTTTPVQQPTPQAQQVQEETKPTEKPKPTRHELQAEVKFSELAFQITNIEDLKWTDCKFELNSGLIRGGYTYKENVMLSMDPLVIPFREFTKGDGTRFDPYETKAQKLTISCQVGGEHGFGYYGIN